MPSPGRIINRYTLFGDIGLAFIVVVVIVVVVIVNNEFGDALVLHGRSRSHVVSPGRSPTRWRRPPFPLRLRSQLSPLLPEENPEADVHRKSISGVFHSDVVRGSEKLFPPTELDRRNAASRTDGYWPYVQRGEEPPSIYTYGEFDIYFFAEILDRAQEYLARDDGRVENGVPSWDGKVFVDIGSGAGRLVLAAAALHPRAKLCRGIEILPGIHQLAGNKLEECRISPKKDPASSTSMQHGYGEDGTWKRSDGGILLKDEGEVGKDGAPPSDRIVSSASEEYRLPSHDGTSSSVLPLAPVEFCLGSFDDPYMYFGDADCIFVFSNCMTPGMMSDLGKSIGRQCRPGTIVVTTEVQIPLEGNIEPVEDDPNVPHGRYQLELLEKRDGYCWVTGGESTAIFYRVAASQWHADLGPLRPPPTSVEEQAYRAVLGAEEEADKGQVVRNVRNAMTFHGFPHSWDPES